MTEQRHSDSGLIAARCCCNATLNVAIQEGRNSKQPLLEHCWPVLKQAIPSAKPNDLLQQTLQTSTEANGISQKWSAICVHVKVYNRQYVTRYTAGDSSQC
jgi:hypothetical protein